MIVMLINTHVRKYPDEPERDLNNAICLPALQVEVSGSCFQQFDTISGQARLMRFIEFIFHQRIDK